MATSIEIGLVKRVAPPRGGGPHGGISQDERQDGSSWTSDLEVRLELKAAINPCLSEDRRRSRIGEPPEDQAAGRNFSPSSRLDFPRPSRGVLHLYRTRDSSTGGSRTAPTFPGAFHPTRPSPGSRLGFNCQSLQCWPTLGVASPAPHETPSLPPPHPLICSRPPP